MLNIIATPIGNLGDITIRARDALEKVEVLLCEDTRNTGRLLRLLGINNRPKLESFYDEVEEVKIPGVVKLIGEGVEVGLVSDAGTPLLSDPGWKLVKRCRELGLEYTALPGACAMVNGLVLSGLPMGRFCFLGFLPKKSGERKRLLRTYESIEGAKVVYESPFRVARLIEEIKEICGEGVEIRVIEEMTKKFEKVSLGDKKKYKGEVTIIFY